VGYGRTRTPLRYRKSGDRKLPTYGCARLCSTRPITHPTLIVHGNKDSVVAPINAFILAEHLPDAQLIVYPDASHGAQYQHAKRFLEHVQLFLREGD
jgi:pimeloyl-ACP methyl ester carboxylesterase